MRDLYKLNLISKVALVIIYCCSSSLGISQDSQNLKSEKLLTIASQLKKGNKFSIKDRTFVVSTIKSKEDSLVYRAFLVLAIAVSKKQFQMNEYMKLVEEKTRTAAPQLAVICASMYPARVKDHAPVRTVSRLKSERRKLQGLLSDDEYFSQITPSDRQFCERILANKSESVRLLAVPVFIGKKGLNLKDRTWADQMITRQTSLSKNSVKQYWDFTRRVVKFRNPVSAKG